MCVTGQEPVLASLKVDELEDRSVLRECIHIHASVCVDVRGCEGKHLVMRVHTLETISSSSTGDHRRSASTSVMFPALIWLQPSCCRETVSA